MSPVERELTFEDDSNGSIARDRFNLKKFHQNGSTAWMGWKYLWPDDPLALRLVPVAGAVSSGSVAGSVSPPGSGWLLHTTELLERLWEIR